MKAGIVLSLGGTIGMFAMSYVVSIASIEWVFYFSAAFTLVCALILIAMRGYFD
jgi:hypothetical protein